MEKYSKSLRELGEEYERNAKIQQFFIDKCKADIKRAKEKKERETVRALKADLLKFYEIKRELTENASILKNYYK